MAALPMEVLLAVLKKLISLSARDWSEAPAATARSAASSRHAVTE